MIILGFSLLVVFFTKLLKKRTNQSLLKENQSKYFLNNHLKRTNHKYLSIKDQQNPCMAKMNNKQQVEVITIEKEGIDGGKVEKKKLSIKYIIAAIFILAFIVGISFWVVTSAGGKTGKRRKGVSSISSPISSVFKFPVHQDYSTTTQC